MKCLACGASALEPVLSLDSMPSRVQNLSSNQIECMHDVMRLDLMKCTVCGLVQFDCSPVGYYRDVIRARHFSKKLRDLHHAQFGQFIRNYDLEGSSIWEVGCGRGEMLSLLEEYPINAYGLEHSAELVEEAQKMGLDVVRGFVDSGNFFDARGPFDAFISINYLEHQPNPCAMLKGIANNLVESAVGLITVPSFDYFIQKATYYEFMRDHIANYDASSLARLLKEAGFSVEEMSRFNEDTIAAIVRKRPNGTERNFAFAIRRSREKLEAELSSFISGAPEGAVAVWGASHQAFTLLSLAGYGPDSIRFIVDSAPFKCGKFSPGTGIPIISPEEYATDNLTKAIIIIAPGYSDEISETIQSLRPDVKQISSVVAGRLVRLV